VSYWTKLAGDPVHINCREPLTDEERDEMELHLTELVKAVAARNARELRDASGTPPGREGEGAGARGIVHEEG
jgi:hypothetical protein